MAPHSITSRGMVRKNMKTFKYLLGGLFAVAVMATGVSLMAGVDYDNPGGVPFAGGEFSTALTLMGQRCSMKHRAIPIQQYCLGGGR